jgi:hypothetical protein
MSISFSDKEVIFIFMYSDQYTSKKLKGLLPFPRYRSINSESSIQIFLNAFGSFLIGTDDDQGIGLLIDEDRGQNRGDGSGEGGDHSEEVDNAAEEAEEAEEAEDGA